MSSSVGNCTTQVEIIFKTAISSVVTDHKTLKVILWDPNLTINNAMQHWMSVASIPEITRVQLSALSFIGFCIKLFFFPFLVPCSRLRWLTTSFWAHVNIV